MSDKMNYVDVIKYALLGLTVLLTSIVVLVLLLFVFKNALFITISLLAISIVSLSLLAINSHINILTAFILVIVYVGAIMILIGYICAINPNIIIEPNYSNLSLLLVLFMIYYTLHSNISVSFDVTTFNLSDYFYSSYGLYIFSIIVLMLFLTLLIVTSQHTVPKGPFRSVS